jgi:hypothetical protein
MGTRTWIAGGVLALACLGGGAAVAQEAKLEVRDGDSVRSVLERHAGQRVTLVLQSGPELTGTVVKVTEQVVHLGQLQGREFFDAAVRLDRVSGVVVRVRAR